MPRKARIVVPGAFHHVMARGIDRQDIFRDSNDREAFLSLLEKQILKDGHRLYAWALIPNHYHLLLRASDHPLGDTMGRINGPYARYFNKKDHRCGYLFQDRFKSLVTQDQNYVETVLRYVHLNPLRAGLCKTLDELDSYRWCGHRILMGNGEWEAHATYEVLRRFGKAKDAARKAYRRFIQEGIDQTVELHEIVEAVRSSNAQTEDIFEPGCWVIGDPQYVRDVLAADTERRLRVARYLRNSITLEHVASEVAKLMEISPQHIARRSRGNLVSDARKIFACLCRHKYGFRVKVIGEYLGIGSSPTSICISKGVELAKIRKILIN